VLLPLLFLNALLSLSSILLLLLTLPHDSVQKLSPQALPPAFRMRVETTTLIISLHDLKNHFFLILLGNCWRIILAAKEKRKKISRAYKGQIAQHCNRFKDAGPVGSRQTCSDPPSYSPTRGKERTINASPVVGGTSGALRLHSQPPGHRTHGHIGPKPDSSTAPSYLV